MKAAIQFSGGRDSLALTYHLRALRDYVDVIMVDTGDMPSAAYRNLDLVKSLGYNVIVLTPQMDRSPVDGSNWIECCYRNIWLPMSEFIYARGYRQVFRGSRKYDPHFHGVFPGDVVAGTLYTMPLWDWTNAQVNNYLGTLLPPEYLADVNGMPDCLTCSVVESCGGKNREVWND